MIFGDYDSDKISKVFVVIEFNKKCKLDVKKWLENKLKLSKEKNGAELLTEWISNSKEEV